jgi:hypothetical protein
VRTLRVAGHPNVEFSGGALPNGTVTSYRLLYYPQAYSRL